MTRHPGYSTGISLVAAVLAMSSGLASAVTAPTSLNNCQNAIKTATAGFIKAKFAAIGTCLQAVSKEVVQDNAVDAGGAASTCVTQFRKLYDSRGWGKQLSNKLAAAISMKCDVGQIGVTHTLADILGSGAGVPQPLLAEDLNAWCTHFGGDGFIDTLQEWTDCITAATECSVDTAIATAYPRALEWLALVRSSMLVRTPPNSDPTRVLDAVAGLDAVKAAIDGPDNDNVASIECGSSCGDGVKSGREACDGGALGGASCTSLGYATGTLTCTAACGFDTGGCGCRTATGTAGADDVLSGKTFSTATTVGSTGTMPANDAVILIPTTSNQAIAAGYHNGSGYCAGDADLVPANIKSGVNLFGVSGTVIQASGTATAAEVVAGQTFSNATTAGVTGTMPNNGGVTLTPTTSDQAIAAGYHDGSGKCTGDADLVPSNIVNGVNIFGVAGTAGSVPAQVLKTGQTIAYGAGSDGDLETGASLSYTDNGDGTISDNATGLMWEKKSDDGSIHDWDNIYTWGMTSLPYTMNGTMVTTFLNQLNNRCKNNGSLTCSTDANCSVPGGPCGFAGYRDWRLPNYKELISIVNLGNAYPCVSSVFYNGCTVGCSVTNCSCTSPGWTWTASSYRDYPNYAWIVSFNHGEVDAYDKSISRNARAVRGGS